MNFSTPIFLAVAGVELLIVFLIVVVICGAIVSLFAIKSGERVKREEQVTRQKVVEAVSEGKLSMEDAEKLTNPKKPWWKGLF